MTIFTKKYLSLDDLSSKMAGRSRSSICRDIKNGNLPAPLRVGGRLYWVEDEVDDHLSTLRIGGTQS